MMEWRPVDSREAKTLKKSHDWPDWWDWELELSFHLLKRMEDRQFDEIDLRSMMERATTFREDVLDGRFVIETRHHRKRWEVVVEPDQRARVLVVITAYPVWD